jgi:FHS family L-fucose permease-like MFS transporter
VGVLAGLAVYVIGSLLYIPACVYASFDVYFVAIFTVAAGCSLLETTCNPYVLSLGDESTAVRRLNFAQAFNPVGSILGIFLAQKLILANLNPATAAERAQMAPDALAGIVRNELFWVCVPYVGLCAIAALVWVFFLRINPFVSTFAEKRVGFGRVATAGLFALVPLTVLYFLFPQMDKVLWIICGMAGPFAYVLLVKDYREMLGILLRRPRYWCGVIAQFFYVGVQIAVWTWLNVYLQKELGITAAQAASYYLISIVLFVACRWIATGLMAKVSPVLLLALFSGAAIACSFGVIRLSGAPLFTLFGLPFPPNVLCLVLLSGLMSLMFPTIYGIALEGVDPRAFKLGAAGLIMSILGGAIITPWMGGILGSQQSAWLKLAPALDATWDVNLKTSVASLHASFIVPAICFAVVFAYAVCAFVARRKVPSRA